jgi:hypothetical protein
MLASLRAATGRDRYIVFDSIPAPATDLVDSNTMTPTLARGSLSAALIAGLREAARLQPRYREVQLHVVSPLAVEELDAATSKIRSLWRGTISMHRVAPIGEAPAVSLVETALTVNDVVGAAIRNALPQVAAGTITPSGGGASSAQASSSPRRGSPSDNDSERNPPGSAGRREPSAESSARSVIVKMVRGIPGVADSVWALTRDRILVVWPSADALDDSLRALASDSGAAIGHMSAYPLAQPLGAKSHVIVWWSDGRPAAIESPSGEGCIRDVGFVPVRTGDFALSLAFRRIVQRLAAPCGEGRALQPLPDADIAALGSPAATLRGAPAAAAPAASRLAPWLLGAALLALLLERLLRRDVFRPAAVVSARKAA